MSCSVFKCHFLHASTRHNLHTNSRHFHHRHFPYFSHFLYSQLNLFLAILDGHQVFPLLPFIQGSFNEGSHSKVTRQQSYAPHALPQHALTSQSDAHMALLHKDEINITVHINSPCINSQASFLESKQQINRYLYFLLHYFQHSFLTTHFSIPSSIAA